MSGTKASARLVLMVCLLVAQAAALRGGTAAARPPGAQRRCTKVVVADKLAKLRRKKAAEGQPCGAGVAICKKGRRWEGRAGDRGPAARASHTSSPASHGAHARVRASPGTTARRQGATSARFGTYSPPGAGCWEVRPSGQQPRLHQGCPVQTRDHAFWPHARLRSSARAERPHLPPPINALSRPLLRPNWLLQFERASLRWHMPVRLQRRRERLRRGLPG
jgi:hypothetical protein